MPGSLPDLSLDLLPTDVLIDIISVCVPNFNISIELPQGSREEGYKQTVKVDLFPGFVNLILINHRFHDLALAVACTKFTGQVNVISGSSLPDSAIKHHINTIFERKIPWLTQFVLRFQCGAVVLREQDQVIYGGRTSNFEFADEAMSGLDVSSFPNLREIRLPLFRCVPSAEVAEFLKGQQTKAEMENLLSLRETQLAGNPSLHPLLNDILHDGTIRQPFELLPSERNNIKILRTVISRKIINGELMWVVIVLDTTRQKITLAEMKLSRKTPRSYGLSSDFKGDKTEKILRRWLSLESNLPRKMTLFRTVEHRSRQNNRNHD